MQSYPCAFTVSTWQVRHNEGSAEGIPLGLIKERKERLVPGIGFKDHFEGVKLEKQSRGRLPIFYLAEMDNLTIQVQLKRYRWKSVLHIWLSIAASQYLISPLSERQKYYYPYFTVVLYG